MDDVETLLQRELQRVAGEARGPAPRAAQARYRQARPSILAVSKLAVGTATVAVALSVSVVAAAAVSGSSPIAWGHAVKVVVDRCDIEQDDPSSQVGPCVGSFVPSGLPLLPTIPGHPSDSTQNGGGHAGNWGPGASRNAPRSRGQAAGAKPTPSVITVPSQLPIVTGQPAIAAVDTPSPSASAAAVATPVPNPSATPVSTPTPTAAPPPSPKPAPSPSATAAPGDQSSTHKPEASPTAKPQ